MSEYRITAFHETSSEIAGTMLFGSRPSDEWVLRLAEEALIGGYVSRNTTPGYDVRLTFDYGYIDVVRV